MAKLNWTRHKAMTRERVAAWEAALDWHALRRREAALEERQRALDKQTRAQERERIKKQREIARLKRIWARVKARDFDFELE